MLGAVKSPLHRPIRRLARAAITVALAALGTAATADDDAFAAQRQLFVIAWAAVEAGAPLPAATDPPALRSYPLYPYLERARLLRALSRVAGAWGQTDDDIALFLRNHAGEPVATELRRAWLTKLAAREQWQAVNDWFDPALTDASLSCQHTRALAALNVQDAEHSAVALWLTPERLPPECEPVFDWLRNRNALTDALVEQRVRALLTNGQAAFARTIARQLPAERAAPLLQWADLLERPEASLDRALEAPAGRYGSEPAALLAGWNRLARNDPEAARERFDRLPALVTPESIGSYALALALGLAWDRRAAEALDAFSAVPAAQLDDYALAWQARAALWARDWARVERSIAAMSAEQRAETRWRYWAARAADERNESALAKRLYASVLPTDNFYAANAAARLGRRVEPHPARLTEDDAAIATLAAQPGFVRARELLLCGLKGPAVIEWSRASEMLASAQRAQAVHLAARWGWHDVSVTTATREKVFYDYALLYPKPYGDEVRSAAELTNLDAGLIYGVIRQESLYRTDAVSSAGAFGLAQLMPETARRVAKEWQKPLPAAADLFDPAVNITLGAAHLRELVNRFDQRTVVALAGYNAGALAAERWLPDQPIDADIWIENIPYNETRDYVQRVLWHSVVFAWLESGRGEKVDSWLIPIAPRGTTARVEPAN
jgi:soluble lytic murein transglycosylase